MNARAALQLLACCALLSCSSPDEPQPTSSRLPAGVSARAGRELISSASVGRIAESQGVAPTLALSLAISDAVLAQEARTFVPFGTATSIERAATARTLLQQLAREAERAGPPSDVELAELVRERWTELDRPDAARTTHAVVINDKPERAVEARRVAERLALAVKSASNAGEFIRLAQAVPHEGFELRAEALPAVTADGRTLERREGVFVARGNFDKTFAGAANQLSARGDQSPVTGTRFGFHVIRLEERVAGSVTPKAELASLLGPEVLTRRAARARRELLDGLKKGAAVEVDRAVDELTARAKLAP